MTQAQSHFASLEMQLVGRSCAICERRIPVALGAAGCEGCDLALHEQCAPTKGRCPRCDEAFGRFEVGPPAVIDARARVMVERGRLKVMLASTVLIFGGLYAALNAAIGPDADASRALAAAARLLLEVGLVVAIFRGHQWVRIVTCFLSALASLVTFVIAGRLLVRSSLEGGLILVALAAVYGTVTLVLASSDARAFVDAARSR